MAIYSLKLQLQWKPPNAANSNNLSMVEESKDL